MSKETGNSGIIMNNPVFNSMVGAIGTNNIVNIDVERNEENFYSDIQKIDSEKLGQDPDAVKLLEEIKKEANNKNKKGALTKLRELAEKVGSSVFAKVVSTVVVDVMKDNGYLPF